MVSTSKILTVSYGTFSCTLEGFDDSFETMKAIAEYFRDLAAEDRYFGAEPPVPDAEMLARIAEREIARRVEAREERGNIVLRAQPFGAVAAPLTPPPAPQTAAQPAPQPVPAPVTAPVPAPVPAAEAPVAATLAATVAQTTAQPPMMAEPDAADEWEDISLDAFAPDSVMPVGGMMPVSALQTSALQTSELQKSDLQDAMPQTETLRRPTPVPHPDPDSVAAKLQRIRDVVTKAAPVDTYSEDEHAVGFADEFLAETAESIESALAQDDLASSAEDAPEDDEIGALLSRLAGETPSQPEVTTAEAVTLTAADQEQDDLIADNLTLDDLAEEPTAEAAPQIEDDLDHADLDHAAHAADTMDDDDDLIEVEVAGDDESDDPAMAGIPRVIKMKRADFEAAIAKGELVPDEDMGEDSGEDRYQDAEPAGHKAAHQTAHDADDADQDDQPQAPAAAGPRLDFMPGADLSPEAEEQLRRELAAVEAELMDISRDSAAQSALPPSARHDDEEDEDDEITSLFDEDDDDADDAAINTPKDSAAAPLVLRDPREQLSKGLAEDDMSRLMAKAESAMTEPENANRRSAIAHLRAAVAATKAEKSAGTLPSRAPADDAFRDDLASVVRPRRPVSDVAGATPRPAEARPAPLKLVAEQRVDLPRPSNDAAVRPRRVSLAPMQEAPVTAATATSDAPGDEFADFVRRMGATALPDLLEAAAAYLVHVEGREEFSRPQLMNKARQGSHAALSREDGLRAFGQLLRQGKILKVRGGRFTAAEDIGFNPAARRAG